MFSLARDTPSSPHSNQSQDSNNASDISSNYSFGSQLSFLDKIGFRSRNSTNSLSNLPDDTAKKMVAGILKMIKQMNQQAAPKIGLVAFMEMIQMYYTHVSMVLLKTFMDHHRILPKPVYFHYYIYFLHYAEYYHYARCHTDIIDPTRTEFHQDRLRVIRQHLKYVYSIIHNNRTEISL